MSILKRPLTLLIFTTLLSGCVPSMRCYAPAVSGSLSLEGAPVAGAEVQVFEDNGERRTAQTGADGRFSTEPIRKLAFAIPLGDTLYEYAVRFVVSGEVYEGYIAGSIGSVPEKLQLQCDLSRPYLRDGKQVYCEQVRTGP